MARKNYRPEEIVAKLRPVEVLQSQGTTVANAVRQIGVTEMTYYRWRREYGGMKTDQLKRLACLLIASLVCGCVAGRRYHLGALLHQEALDCRAFTVLQVRP